MGYECKYCNKIYSSYSSRSNHIKKFHSEHVVQKEKFVVESEKNVVQKEKNVVQNKDNRICKFCNKKLCDRKYRWKHELICKMKTEEIENLELKEKEIIELKKQNENLMNMLQKALKIHPMKLNSNNNNNNNNTINQTVNIVQLGHEDLCNVLSERQKMSVLDRQAMSLNNLVELVHVSGKFEKFQNVYITNLRSSFAYRFDEKLNKFISVNKNELLNDLLDCRMYDIEKFFKEIHPKLEAQKAAQIKKFIDRMANEEDKMKGLKREEITLILYNNREKIISSSEKNQIKELEV